MKKISVLMMVVLLVTTMGATVFAEAPTAKRVMTAVPTTQNVLVNGEKVDFDAYNIGGNNYFKIRDLAYALKDTDSKFEVIWDGEKNAINLKNYEPYTMAGGEMGKAAAGNKTATLAASKIYLDGNEIKPTVYIINGSSYFKLVDVGAALGFTVLWDETTRTVNITSDTGSNAIKIGLNYELSGDLATYGQASVDGIKMAIDEVNGAGGVNGKRIQLIIGDNKSDETETILVATKFMSQDKVAAVLGPCTSWKFKAQMILANQYQIPVLTGTGTADDATMDANGKVLEFAFRACVADSLQGNVMARFAQENLKAKNAVIIYDSSSDYGKGLAKTFKEAFAGKGGKIVAEEGYIAQDKDFSGILTKIKDKQFDVIYVPGYYIEAGLIIKQAREMGITAPILGCDGYDSPTLLEYAGASALNNVYYTNHYSALDKDPLVVKFIADFRAKYGIEPNAFHALGYDTGKFIADAIRRGGDEPIAIKDALASTVNFKGVTGTFSVDKNHNAIKSTVVIELKDGKEASAVKVNP